MVRVFDGYLPSLSGPIGVDHRATGTKYKVNHLDADVGVEWILPSNAQLVEGEGTNQITIDWGENGGTLHAIFEGACGLDTLSIPIAVAAPFIVEESFENFDAKASITFKSSTGTLTDESPNPASNDVNNTALCGKYDRNAVEVFDVLTYAKPILLKMHLST